MRWVRCVPGVAGRTGTQPADVGSPDLGGPSPAAAGRRWCVGPTGKSEPREPGVERSLIVFSGEWRQCDAGLPSTQMAMQTSPQSNDEVVGRLAELPARGSRPGADHPQPGSDRPRRRRVVTPRVMGSAVELYPLVILIALTVGSELLGAAGALLAIAVAASAAVVIDEIRVERIRTQLEFSGVERYLPNVHRCHRRIRSRLNPDVVSGEG